jgi:hypothetical protein
VFRRTDILTHVKCVEIHFILWKASLIMNILI